MGTTQSDAESDVHDSADPDDDVYSPAEGVVDIVRNSLLLKIALGGVLFALIGLFFDSGLVVPTGGLWSIWAAVFATWGAGLFVVGILGYGFFALKRR